VRGEDTLAGWRGGEGSKFWKAPDTALYSTYVSTLWVETRELYDVDLQLEAESINFLFSVFFAFFMLLMLCDISKI
jgi:hypothetical protein